MVMVHTLQMVPIESRFFAFNRSMQFMSSLEWVLKIKT